MYWIVHLCRIVHWSRKVFSRAIWSRAVNQSTDHCLHNTSRSNLHNNCVQCFSMHCTMIHGATQCYTMVHCVVREAPFNLSPPLFGHCPNSNYTPPPHSNGHSGALFFRRDFPILKGCMLLETVTHWSHMPWGPNFVKIGCQWGQNF